MSELMNLINKIKKWLDLCTEIDFFFKVNRTQEGKNFSLSGMIQSKGFSLKYTDLNQSEKFVNLEGSSWVTINENNLKELMVFLDKKINQ